MLLHSVSLKNKGNLEMIIIKSNLIYVLIGSVVLFMV